MMKKSAKIWSVILSLVMGVSVFSLSACNTEPEKKPDPTPPAHTHTYAATWSNDETNHWHAATCEHKTEVKDKAAHDTKGTDGACSVCGYKKIETPPAHEHTFADVYTLNDTQHWKAATCEHANEKGELANHNTDGAGGSCSVCGFIPHTHTYTRYEQYADRHCQARTCDAKYNCNDSNVEAPEFINVEEHTFVDGVCTVCQYKNKYLSSKDCIICEVCGGCINMQCPHEGDEGHKYCADRENAKKTVLEAEDAYLYRNDGDATVIDDRGGMRGCVHAAYANVKYTINVTGITANTTATLRVKCGRGSAGNAFTTKATVFVNDEEFNTKAIMSQPNSNDSKCSMDWIVLGCITLKPGENTIELIQYKGGWEVHIDKIELITDAGVTITMEKTDNSEITEVFDPIPTIDKYKKAA